MFRAGFWGFLVFCSSCSLSADALSRELGAVQRELTLLLQGDEPVRVRASPALCAGGGSPSGRYAEDPVIWYFSDEGCELEYPPRPDAIVTSMSESTGSEVVKDLFVSPARRARLNALLSELKEIAAAGTLTLQQRLMVQSTSWEVAAGLSRLGRRFPETQQDLEPAFQNSLDLLKLTLFSPEEVAELPATLGDLPRLAEAPEISPFVRMILERDPEMIEIHVSYVLQEEALKFRFAARKFLTVIDTEDRDRFRQYVLDPAHHAKAGTSKDLRILAQVFPGVHAIRVMYFNVLMKDFTILPTQQVAFWDHVTYRTVVNWDTPFDKREAATEFLSIAYHWNLAAKPAEGQTVSTERPVYRRVDPKSMARRSLIDVKPGNQHGRRVTTLRGQCLHCHQGMIRTFYTHFTQPADFVDPLTRRGRELLTPYSLENFEPKMMQWLRQMSGG